MLEVVGSPGEVRVTLGPIGVGDLVPFNIEAYKSPPMDPETAHFFSCTKRGHEERRMATL
jgi:hypothetical protein